MKQQPTLKQWETTLNQWVELLEEVMDIEGAGLVLAPPPTIGEMIEFIEKEAKGQFAIFRRILDWKVVGVVDGFDVKKTELCDALFEVVKYLLKLKIKNDVKN